jgi:hypothetical protein
MKYPKKTGAVKYGTSKKSSRNARSSMSSTTQSVTIATGLVRQAIEQILEAMKKIGPNQFIEVPWKEQTLTFKVHDEQEVKVIQHK